MLRSYLAAGLFAEENAVGPTCEIELSAPPDSTTLNAIDAYLNRVVQNLIWTIKGRHWEGWVDERPVIVSVEDADNESPAAVCLAAGCNSPKDYDMLRKLSKELAAILGSSATEPIK